MAKQAKKFVATIPLSRRGKKRYILFSLHAESNQPFQKSEVERALNQHLLACYGVLGMPLHRYKFMLYDSHSGKGIIRCAHTSKEPLIVALASFSALNGQKVTVRTHKTSGTLQSLQPFFASPA